MDLNKYVSEFTSRTESTARTVKENLWFDWYFKYPLDQPQHGIMVPIYEGNPDRTQAATFNK